MSFSFTEVSTRLKGCEIWRWCDTIEHWFQSRKLRFGSALRVAIADENQEITPQF